MPAGEAGLPAADLHLAVGDGGQPVALRWRAFGAPADLDLSLHGAGRTAIVSELLARCRADQGDPAVFGAQAQRLTLSGRIGGLAAIVARSAGSDEIAVDLRCPAWTCRTPLQIAVPLASVLELSRLAEEERTIIVTAPGVEAIRVRRPTGDDQQAWQARTYADGEAAERAMVASLLSGGGDESALSTAVRAAIDAALEDADPLTCFRVTAVCPACEEEQEYAVDLEAVLLARLRQLQHRVLHDVHRLATRYGWSEHAIAAMPPWRRQAYLDLIEREET
jgi:hypothetical protein